MTIEVGKKYKHKQSGSVYEVLHVGEEQTFVRVFKGPSIIGAEYIIPNGSMKHYYEEYVEPKVIKTERYVCNYNGTLYVDTYAPSNRVGKIEITWHSEEGLSVKIL